MIEYQDLFLWYQVINHYIVDSKTLLLLCFCHKNDKITGYHDGE